MELSLRTPYGNIAELTIESGSTKIVEDLPHLKDGKWAIPDATIENLISVAREANLFNGKSDIDFVKSVFESFLNDSERERFLQEISE